MKKLILSFALVLAIFAFSSNSFAGYWPSGGNYCKIVFVQQCSTDDVLVRYTYGGTYWNTYLNNTLSESIRKNILAVLLTAAAQDSNVQMDFVAGKICGARIFTQ